jgi:DNA-binding MarR family transcriptional regulator
MAISVLSNDALGSLHQAMRAAGHRQITGAQNLVLVHIGPDGARSSDLARAQRVSRQAISAVLNDLEASRHVRRQADANDGRGVVFVPTAKGRRVLADYVAGIDDLEARFLDVLGSARFGELAASARDLSRMLALEHVFSLASHGPAVADAPSERRQGDLAELGNELFRWLGKADAWWLAGFLRQRVIDQVETPQRGQFEASR